MAVVNRIQASYLNNLPPVIKWTWPVDMSSGLEGFRLPKLNCILILNLNLKNTSPDNLATIFANYKSCRIRTAVLKALLSIDHVNFKYAATNFFSCY